MYLQEALEELKNKRCEAIESKNNCIGIKYEAIENYVFTPKNITDDDWELINPIPETKIIEVVRYMTSNGSIFKSLSEAKNYQTFTDPSRNVIKLVGYDEVKIPRKTKHRKLIEEANALRIDGVRKENVFLYAEWEE